MKYIDANIFINSILNNDNIGTISRKILSDVANKKIKACTSVLTWDEIVFTFKKCLGHKKAVIHGERFLRFPNLVLIGTNLQIVASASNLMKKYEINPRDAIHTATALISESDEIISSDTDFEKIKEIKRIDPKNYR